MVLDPDVLLLDEPLGALDLKLRGRMKIELKLLQNQFNTTFLYITHDQSEALVMSDHVAVMDKGRFVQIGTPQELYNNPASGFVAGFVGDNNRLFGQVVSLSHGEARIMLDNISDEKRTEITATCGEPMMREGDRVEVFVWPDAMSTIKQGDGNHIPAIVDNLLFNGASSRLLVRLNGQIEAEISHRLTDNAATPSPGDEIDLFWRREHCLCFSVAEK